MFQCWKRLKKVSKASKAGKGLKLVKLNEKGVITICTNAPTASDLEKCRTFPGGRELTDEEYNGRHPALEHCKPEDLKFCDLCNDIHERYSAGCPH